jgi:hypothetical protein
MKRATIVIFSIVLIAACSTKTAPSLSKFPYSKFINIQGTIDIALNFKLKVSYRTTATEPKCMKYNIALGKSVSKTHELDYYPDIVDSSYTLKLPLQQLKPDSECAWKPVMVSVCAASKGNKPTQCSSVFAFRGIQDIDDKTVMECDTNGWCFNKNDDNNGYINKFNTAYVLNITRRLTSQED